MLRGRIRWATVWNCIPASLPKWSSSSTSGCCSSQVCCRAPGAMRRHYQISSGSRVCWCAPWSLSRYSSPGKFFLIFWLKRKVFDVEIYLLCTGPSSYTPWGLRVRSSWTLRANPTSSAERGLRIIRLWSSCSSQRSRTQTKIFWLNICFTFIEWKNSCLFWDV